MEDSDEPRPTAELQRAHDILGMVFVNEGLFSAHDREYACVLGDVLCWVLRHEHGPDCNFQRFLAFAEKRLEKSGFLKLADSLDGLVS